MYTQCPKCLTYFQVTAEHLKVAQGNVRCGQCSNVFSALGNLSEVPPQGADSKPSSTNSYNRAAPSAKQGTTPGTGNSPQSKLTNAIAAIQALNQSSQKILSESRKSYVSQLQRQAQAKRKYTDIDSNSSTARDLNQDEPETQNNLAQHDDINFDEALAAIEDIEIDVNDTEVLDDETISQFSATEDEDITPPYDASHLVEDYNVADSYLEKKKNAKKPAARKSQKQPATSGNDEINYSELELPATDQHEAGKTQARPRKAKPSKRSKKKNVSAKQSTDKKPAASEKEQTIAIPQHIVSDPEVVIENNIPTLAIPKQLLEDFEQDQHIHPAHYRSMITWGLLSLILMLAFLGQAIYFKHNELGQVSQLRPYVEFFCRHASCELAMQTDIRQIELLGQDIRSHPKNKKALLVSATIINNASFTQSYPGLRLSFSDINGEKVASRNFLPNDYLPKNLDIDRGMESNIPIQLELEIVDPGKNAVNFEFDFFSI